MANGFTDQEKKLIVEQLKSSAKECVRMQGMRKTSVDQLVNAIGISKGAFYKFYPFKELLFLEVLEDMHTEIFDAAVKALSDFKDSPVEVRLAQSVFAVCKARTRLGLTAFVEKDLTVLLRKIPFEVQQKYYHSDEVHICEFLQKSGIIPVEKFETAVAVVCSLLVTEQNRQNLGKEYADAQEILVYGACKELLR